MSYEAVTTKSSNTKSNVIHNTQLALALTGTSIPSTSSLRTTPSNRQENCYQGTKGSSTSNSRQISHNNGHWYPGSHESLDENSGHYQETYQDTTQGTAQQGCRKSIPQDQMLHPKVNPNNRKDRKKNPFAYNTKPSQLRTQPRSCRNPPHNSVISTGNITVISYDIRGFQSNRNLLLPTILDSHP